MGVVSSRDVVGGAHVRVLPVSAVSNRGGLMLFELIIKKFFVFLQWW